MAKQSAQYRLIVLSLVALAMLGFLAFVFYSLRSENREISRLSKLVEKREAEIALIDSALAFRESSPEEIEAFESLVLTEEKLVSAIESIESAGRALRLDTEIVSVSHAGDVSEKEFQEIEIVIESTGSWSSNFSFLKAIENLPYRVIVKEASLMKATGAWRSHILISLNTLN